MFTYSTISKAKVRKIIFVLVQWYYALRYSIMYDSTFAWVLYNPVVIWGRFRQSVIFIALQWRHNERDGASNHQPHDCLLNRLFRHRSIKHQRSASLAFVRGIHRWPVNSPHKWPVTRKMFPFDDVIMENWFTFLSVIEFILSVPFLFSTRVSPCLISLGFGTL